MLRQREGWVEPGKPANYQVGAGLTMMHLGMN